MKTWSDWSDAIGVSLEFIFWPLLTTTASLMGTNSSIKINQEWYEPSIIYSGKKRRKEMATLKRFRKPIEGVQRKLHVD